MAEERLCGHCAVRQRGGRYALPVTPPFLWCRLCGQIAFAQGLCSKRMSHVSLQRCSLRIGSSSATTRLWISWSCKRRPHCTMTLRFWISMTTTSHSLKRCVASLVVVVATGLIGASTVQPTINALALDSCSGSGPFNGQWIRATCVLRTSAAWMMIYT